MPRLHLSFGGSLEGLCQELETELGRNFLVDITPEMDGIDVGKPKSGERWYAPVYKDIKFIIVRLRRMFRNDQLARVALVDGQVTYDDAGPVYDEHKDTVRAIKKICK